MTEWGREKIWKREEISQWNGEKGGLEETLIIWGGTPKIWNYLLEVGPLWYMLPRLGECSRNPSVSVCQMRCCETSQAVFGFSEIFCKDSFNTFARFMMGDLWVNLPTLCWVFSSFWPKTAWPPPRCPTLSIHPISPRATFLFCFPEWKKSSKRNIFADMEEVKQKTAESASVVAF